MTTERDMRVRKARKPTPAVENPKTDAETPPDSFSWQKLQWGYQVSSLGGEEPVLPLRGTWAHGREGRKSALPASDKCGMAGSAAGKSCKEETAGFG